MPYTSRNFEGLEVWLLPDSIRLRNSISKSEFIIGGPKANFISICCILFAINEAGFDGGDLQELRDLGLMLVEPIESYLSYRSDELLRLRSGITYWDYGDPTVLQRDAADMLKFVEQEPPRRISRENEVGVEVESLSDQLQILSVLAHQVFDSRFCERFHHELVDKKLAPSIGARHGLGAYLHGHVAGFDGMQWLRINSDGTDTIIGSLGDNLGCREAVSHECMLICVKFERYQWRYRNGWVYQCVYLDLGHALATLRLLAKMQGCSLAVKHASANVMGIERELEDEPLIQVSIIRNAV